VSDQPTLLFADQIRAGMRVEAANKVYGLEPGVFTALQIRTCGGSVRILGVRDDGSPCHVTDFADAVWLRYDAGSTELS